MRGTDMAPLDRAKAKFQANLQFRLSKVSLDTRAKQEYLHTPLKVVVDIGKTTVAPCCRENKVRAPSLAHK